MDPGATSRLTFLTAQKPANSLVRFSVLRIGSALTAVPPFRLLVGLLALSRIREQKCQFNKT
jgi:hypothetical protein